MPSSAMSIVPRAPARSPADPHAGPGVMSVTGRIRCRSQPGLGPFPRTGCVPYARMTIPHGCAPGGLWRRPASLGFGPGQLRCAHRKAGDEMGLIGVLVLAVATGAIAIFVVAVVLVLLMLGVWFRRRRRAGGVIASRRRRP